MNILILADMPAPYRVEVFRGIAKEHHVEVFFKTCKDEARHAQWFVTAESSFDFHILDSKAERKLYAACTKNIRKYNAVLCYDPWSWRARSLQRLCQKKSIPYALNADGAVQINVAFPKKQIKTYYVKRAPLCLAGCNRAMEYFKAYGAKEENVIQHPFTSLHQWEILDKPCTSEEKKQLKKKLGIQENLTFLAVGQFIHRKGFDLLLSAWKKTTQEGQLYIIGGGPLKDQYQTIIKRDNLQNVNILDFKSPEELRNYYLASDVFIMPTREDIWGLVINEAMASGLPVITSDRCTAGNELIREGWNGYRYVCENVDSLAKHMDHMYKAPEAWAHFPENVLNTIRVHTLENVVQSHLSSLRMLINKEL